MYVSCALACWCELIAVYISGKINMKKSSNQHNYESVVIHPLLQPYIEKITIEQPFLNVNHSLYYKVMPSTSIVMGFQYHGRLHKIQGDQVDLLDRSGISGLQTNPCIFQRDSETRTILVRFKPWGVSAIFSEAAYVFSNTVVNLNNIIKTSRLAILEERLNLAINQEDLAMWVQNFLLEQLLVSKRKIIPPHFIAAVNSMMTNKTQSIAMVAKTYGFSERSLERKFHDLVGVSPKKFSSMIRFEKAIAHLESKSDWEKMGANLGYYDQSHFIHEFKQFANLTPKQFIQDNL
jgi:AraC-like DNA-binding protein